MNHGNRFSGFAQVEDLEDGEHDELLRDLSYTTADKRWTIVIPGRNSGQPGTGFITDYASIPRPLWVVIPPRGKYNRGAIIHDALYQMAPIDPRTNARVTQAAADDILREACENLDVRTTQRLAIWLGLRAGGWLTWRRYRRGESAVAKTS